MTGNYNDASGTVDDAIAKAERTTRLGDAERCRQDLRQRRSDLHRWTLAGFLPADGVDRDLQPYAVG